MMEIENLLSNVDADNIQVGDLKEVIKYCRKVIKEIKAENRLLRRAGHEKNKELIENNKELINLNKMVIKQCRKAIWALRLSNVLGWFRSGWEWIKSIVNRIVNWFGKTFGNSDEEKTTRKVDPKYRKETIGRKSTTEPYSNTRKVDPKYRKETIGCTYEKFTTKPQTKVYKVEPEYKQETVNCREAFNPNDLDEVIIDININEEEIVAEEAHVEEQTVVEEVKMEESVAEEVHVEEQEVTEPEVQVAAEEVHVEEQTTVEEPVTEVKMETQQVKNEKLNERYIQASEDETIRFIEFVSKNFNKLNSTNKGLFVENKPRSISRALRKGSKTVAKLLVPEYVGGKPAIHIKLDSYVKNDVDSFINYVIKNNIVDFSKVTNKF